MVVYFLFLVTQKCRFVPLNHYFVTIIVTFSSMDAVPSGKICHQNKRKKREAADMNGVTPHRYGTTNKHDIMMIDTYSFNPS